MELWCSWLKMAAWEFTQKIYNKLQGSHGNPNTQLALISWLMIGCWWSEPIKSNCCMLRFIQTLNQPSLCQAWLLTSRRKRNISSSQKPNCSGIKVSILTPKNNFCTYGLPKILTFTPSKNWIWLHIYPHLLGKNLQSHMSITMSTINIL